MISVVNEGQAIKDSSRAAVPWPVTFIAVIHLLQ